MTLLDNRVDLLSKVLLLVSLALALELVQVHGYERLGRRDGHLLESANQVWEPLVGIECWLLLLSRWLSLLGCVMRALLGL